MFAPKAAVLIEEDLRFEAERVEMCEKDVSSLSPCAPTNHETEQRETDSVLLCFALLACVRAGGRAIIELDLEPFLPHPLPR